MQKPSGWNMGMTVIEAVVVLAVVAILVALLLPSLAAAHRKSSRVFCNNNLKQIGLGYRIWAGDNHDFYPAGLSVTDGGTREEVAQGNAISTFQVMSNELSTVKILICDGDTASHGDTGRCFAIDFAELSHSNISYFVGADATNENPKMILSGDSNFKVGDQSVKAGLLLLKPNEPVAWAGDWHRSGGYLGLGDGSVNLSPTAGLHHYLQQTDLVTNRLAIP